MTFTYSSKRKLRRQQVSFVTAALDRLPTDVQELIDNLDFEVVFRAWNGRSAAVYHPAEKRVYLPPRYWKDQLLLAKWMREENKAIFVHELFHAVDMQRLTNIDRSDLYVTFTNNSPSGTRTIYFGVEVPTEWVPRDWAQSPAELFADTGVETFTDLPPHTRADGALKVTPEAKQAVHSLLAA